MSKLLKMQLESVAIANALQLEGRSTSRQSFWAVLANFVLRMRTNCYFRASAQNFDIAIRFSDPDLLNGSSNLASRRFHAETLTFDI